MYHFNFLNPFIHAFIQITPTHNMYPSIFLSICLSKNPPLQFQIQRIRQAQTWTGVVVDRTWILTKARKSNIGPISTNGSRRENWRLLPIQQLPILKTLFLRLKKKQIQALSLQLDKQFTYIAMLKTLEKDRWEPFLKVKIFWEGHKFFF